MILDLPSVVSGHKIGLFDPHQIHFGSNKSGEGFTMEMARNPIYKDQFSPYNVLGCNVTEHYNGTLFRFPLRRRPSELSPNVCTTDRIRDLFQSFQADAHLVLLFLKAVEAITIYEWLPGKSEPTEVFKVQLSEATRETVRAERERLLSDISSARSLEGHFKAGEELARFYHVEITCTKRGQDPVTQCWLVHNFISSKHEKVNSTATEHHQIPWVGLAVPIDPMTEHADGLGRIFCFLPLPPSEDADSNTGLPVHVQGSFSVADNRRSLKWPAEDRQKDEKAFWNQLLTEQLLTQAYVGLILYTIQLQGTGTTITPEVVYRMWPDPHRVRYHWAKYLLPRLLRDLSQHAVLWTEALEGKWVRIQEAIVNETQKSDLSPHETVAVEEMLRIGYSVVLSPPAVTSCLDKIANEFKVATIRMSPQIVRTCLKKSDRYQQMHSNDKVHLLKYVIQDECYSDLDSLHLLPLSNGEFTSFEASCSSVYIATPQCPQPLFPGLERHFLDEKIDSPVYNSLKASGCRRLSVLVPDMVPPLVRCVLPSQWATSKISTVSQPKQIGGLSTKKWLMELWKWINKNLDVVSVSNFEGIHIVPVTSTDGSKKLMKLDVEQPLIFPQLPGTNIKIQSDLASGLEAIGCTVLVNAPQYLCCCHQLHGTYVCRPAEIVTCIARVYGTPDYRVLTHSQRKQIVPLLSAALQVNPILSTAEKKVLARLPVIRQYGSDDLISVAECSEVAPNSRELPEHLPIQVCLLASPSKEEETVMDKSSVKYRRLTVEDIYYQKIIPQFHQYKDEEKEQLMVYLLENIHLIAHSKSDILRRLSRLEFVKTKDLVLKAPQKLFSPTEKYTEQLFCGLPVFPIGIFDVDKTHGQLLCRHVGLRQMKDLSYEELLQIVHRVANSGVQERAKALLDVFVRCKWAQLLLQQKTSFNAVATMLSRVAWVPVINKPPQDYPCNLHWAGCSSLCVPGSVVTATGGLYTETLQLVLGSQLHVVDYVTPLPVNLATLLGFAVEETVFGAVVRHLRSAHDIWTKGLPNDKETSKLDTVLHKIIILLAEGYCSSTKVQEAIKRELRNFGSTNWVWLGMPQGFVRPDQLFVSSTCPVSFEPWLFKVEHYQHIKSCKHLLKEYGLKDSIGKEDALLVLAQMQSSSSGVQVKEEQQKRNLSLAIDILNWITSDPTPISDRLKAMVLVPVDSKDNRLELAPLSELKYCDAKWLDKVQDSELDGYKLIHKEVSQETASKLGVPSISSRLARSVALEFEFEQLGQHEPLTLRLKNILKDYKDDAGIFKELVQNADDAGATKVRFLVDWRKHPTTSLLSPGMKRCQGPALWAYNDSVFRDEDFKNIAKLAAATKQANLDKIGRFGLGFTSVYHITDVPSFVSRRFVVIFDPHTTHLGDHIQNASKPGVRIDFIEQPVAKLFQDQFRPYKGVFGCNLESDSEFPGTLFRFPFRTLEQSATSEIKGEFYGERQVRASIAALKYACPKLLLFLNNVQSVELFELGAKAKDVSEMKLLLSVQSETTVFPQTKPCTDILSACCEEVRQQRPFPSTNCRKSTALSQISFSTLEGKKTERSKETWLINARTGDGEALEYACSKDGKELGLVPFAGVAVKLDCSGGNGSPLEEGKGLPAAVDGEAFCFLPLSETTGLPFHTNGFFSVNSYRRGIWWFGTKETRVKGDEDRDPVWNKKLIDDPLVKSCIGLLKCFATVLNTSDPNARSTYYKLWPSVSGTSEACWRYLAQQFYAAVAKCEENVVCTSGSQVEWSLLSDCLMLRKNVAKRHPNARRVMREFCDAYVEFPDHVVEGLRAADDSLLDDISVNEIQFVESYFAPNVTTLQSSVRDGITITVLKRSLEDGSLAESVRTLSLIPCSPNGMKFKMASELVDPSCSEVRLYLAEECKFPADGVYCKDDILFAMKRLGMRSTGCFTWDDVIERARTVEELETRNHRHAVERITALVDLIEELTKSTGQPSGDHIRKLRKLRFLPIANRPKSYPLPVWHADTIAKAVVACPEDLYNPTCTNTVGSQALILDSSLQLSVPVANLLGVKSRPDLAMVLKHLTMAVDIWRKTSSQPKPLNSLIVEVYSELEERITDHVSRDLVVSTLKDKEWIKIGSHTVKSQQLAFNWDKEAAPYLMKVPYDLKQSIGRLLQAVGVRNKFTCDDFVWALKRLYSDTAEDGHRLANRHMRTARLLLEELQNVDERELAEYKGTIPVLSEEKILLPASALAYNDAPWIVLPNEEQIFVHKYISRSLALHLGVKLVRSKILEQYVEEWPGEPFGQHEPLTQRLKNILEGYPVGDAILKELLQNADDARASELHFIYDKREHGTERVFSEKWCELQGKALCVYNNRPFSQDDIKGIQKLGQGSKRDDPALTGQYGIGFNAVYHLTDCPSFITNNESLCVMDPHCRYADGATMKRPGRLWRTDKSFWDRCPDVRPCYCEIPGVTLEGGTLFRFPLRTLDMASRSQISKSAWEGSRMEVLFEEFKDGAADMLLFLNHVSSIKLSVLENDGSINSSFHVSSAMSEKAKEKRRSLADHIASNKQKPTDSIEYLDVTYELTTTKEEPTQAISLSSQTWLVHQSFGIAPECKQLSFPDVSRLSLLPRAGIAATIRPKSDVDNCSKAFCFLPLPVTTHLPVHVNGHFALNDSRRNLWQEQSKFRTSEKQEWNENLIKRIVVPAYAKFLLEARAYVELTVPSASETEEPRKQLEDGLGWFYGLFPQLTESRDHYWDMLAREVYRYIAECRLPLLVLTDQPLPSELQATEGHTSSRKGGKLIDKCRGWFSKVPTIQWLPIATRQETVPGLFCAYFWNMEETCSMFREVSTSHTIDGNVRAYVLKCLLLLLGFPVVVSPLSVRTSFERVDRNDATATVSPKAVGLFLANHMDPQLGCTLRLGDVQTTVLRSAAYVSIVLQYLLTHNGIDVTQLKGVPLLVTQNGQLKQFSQQDPVYVTRYSKLLPNNSEVFLFDELISIVTHCQNWYQAKVFKELTPQCLAGHLPSSGVFPCNVPTETSYLQWNEEQGPKVDWITTLWRYLSSLEGNQKDALEHLSRWPVIPLHQRQHLVPPQLGHSVFCFDFVRSPFRDVETVLKLMEVPELNVELTCGLNSPELHPHLKPLVADLQRPESVANALWYMYGNRPPSTPLRTKDAESLLKYFQTNVQYKGKATVVPNGHLVKQLPLFECLDGSLTDIASCYECHTLPEVPANGAKVWMDKAKCVTFFKKKPILSDLYEALGLDNLTPSKVYFDFILESLPDMAPEDRVAHLLFIRQNHEYWICENEKTDKVMCKLKRIRCLPGRDEKSGEEILLPVSSFFDWEIDVFKLFLKPASFPPESLRDYRWHKFFGELGLQTTARPDQLIHFAQTLEKESIGCLRSERQEFEEKSEAVVNHLFSHYSSDKQLLQQIANIAFIPARMCQKTLVKLARPHADRLLSASTSGWVMSFTESVRYSQENERLCWTVAGLLPSWTMQYLRQSHRQDIERARALQIKTEPSVSNVLQNLVCVIEDCQQVICPNQNVDEELTSTLIDVLEVTFKHLQEKCCSALRIPIKLLAFKDLRRLSNLCTVDSFDARAVVEKLHSYPCIFIEDSKEFVKPCQVVSNLSTENSSLAPYLCRLPPYLARCGDILKGLGVEEQPQAFHYARVLEQLWDNSNANEGGHRKLLPEEYSAALTAIELLFKELKRICLRTSYVYLKPVKQQHYSEEDLRSCLDPLFLLSRENTMESSGELIFLDRPEYEGCVSSFSGKHFLPPLQAFGLSPLPQETVNLLPQELRPRHLSELARETLVTQEEPDESLSLQSKDMEEYAQELQSLVSSDTFVSGLYSTIVHYQKTSSFSEKAALALTRLKLLEFHCLPKVVTCLILKDPPGGIVPGSERPVTCFMEERDEVDGRIKLYVAFSDRNRTIDMVSDLSVILRRLLEIDLPGEIVVSLLGCRSPSDIWQCLARKGIAFTDYHKDFTHVSDVFRLGATVDEQYEDDGLVINNLNYSFQPGEWVAYEVTDDCKVYAQVNEEVTDETTPNLEKRYRINIGRKELIVSAVAIYKFDRRLREQRLPTPSSALVPTDDPTEPSINPNTTVQVKTCLLRQILDGIWRISDQDDCRKAVRRLYLRWHPDTSNDPDAYEVFQFLRQEVTRRESQEIPPSSSNYHPTTYSSFYSSWNSTVASTTLRRCRRSYSSSRSTYQTPSPTPDPGLGRKFVQQATADYDAASYLMKAEEARFYATICFLCQQAAEKALKGVWYVKTGLSYYRRLSHSIRDLVGLQQLSGVPLSLDNALSRLSDLDHETTRYPSSSTDPPAVSATYSHQRAESCLSAARDLLEKVQELIRL